ncbi:LysR family transcriptional regulator [Paractinoplanes ferrugineus]|uniref:LysR family transcriptional regulator n=1 Tax=Paractinoplanes ferrugineus TaxID=113564 RepID=A0A919J240_9ACTN|nr:LysR family transcriptional regulator [Actinoplanes ferrugineus]GIE13105.1 LysR family transcriptional regulator [Actinoplanes ferrugineus]
MSDIRVSSDALAAFAAFADSLNLTRAAEQLHISQPALHSKLATLSREFGLSLYERIGNRLELTPGGENVARYAREHQQRLEAFLTELHGVPADRPLVTAAGHTAYLYLLGPTIRRMLAERPGSLRPLHTDRTEMQTAVRTGRAHLGISNLHVLPTDLTAVPIASYPQMLLMPESHRLANKKAVRLKDLAGSDLIVPPPARPHRISLERALTDAEVAWNIAVEAEGLPMTLDFATLGVGLAVVAGCVTPAPGLTVRPITDLPVVTFHAVHRPGALDDPRVCALLDTIRNDIRSQPSRVSSAIEVRPSCQRSARPSRETR